MQLSLGVLAMTSLYLLLLAVPKVGAQDTIFIEGEGYAIPAVLNHPATGVAAPGLLMLHGTASQKNEVGNLYARLAEGLAKRGIASLRIDFAGSGESSVSYREYSLTSATQDAQTALRFLGAQDRVNAQALAVLGFSQGGLIAQSLITREPQIRTLITWSTVATDGVGSFQTFFDQHYAQAKEQGYASVRFPWLTQPLQFDLRWFEEIREQRTLSAMSTYTGPILAIAGSADSTVTYTQSVDLIAQSTNVQSRSIVLAGADHIFRVLEAEDLKDDAEGKNAKARSDELLLRLSIDWLVARLQPSVSAP